MKRILAVFALAASLLAAAIDIDALPTLGDSSTQATVFQRYMVAKKRFEIDSFTLFSQKWSDLTPTLTRQRDRQLIQIEIQSMRFKYLLQHDPGRIVTTEGLDALSAFEWTAADNDKLRRRNSDYVALENFLATIDAELAADPDLLETQKRLLNVGTDTHFLKIAHRFKQHTDTLESELTPR